MNATHIAIYGDAGRGNQEQRDLGRAMSRRHAIQPFDFALSTGDNQYDPTSPGIMKTIFEDPFADLIRAGVPFYQTLGNHDMDEDRVVDQLQYSREVDALGKKRGGWVLPAENYVIEDKNVKIIVLNVTAALCEFFYPHAALEFARKHLEGPRAPWTIISCHYHIWSTGLRGDHDGMKEAFLPLFERYPIDFFFAGHEHHAEMFAPWRGVHGAIVGNGSEIREDVMPSDQECLFRTNEIGFAELTLDERSARFAFIDRQGQEIWEQRITKDQSPF